MNLVVVIILLCGLLEAVRGVPMPPRRARPSLRLDVPARSGAPSTASSYEALYRSMLRPLNLYLASPPRNAPLVSPNERATGSFSVYTTLLTSPNPHPAYIPATPLAEIDAVTRRAARLVSSAHPPAEADQRAFLDMMENLASRAKEELQNALHPENVAGQHQEAVRALGDKYEKLLKGLTDEIVSILTHDLEEAEQERFVDIVDMLTAEKRLLEVIEQTYGARFPLLG